MKKLVILSGYARTGKTTALEVAEGLGYTVVSTSVLLHRFVNLLLTNLFGQSKSVDTSCKKSLHRLETTFNKINTVMYLKSRDLLITVAEKCIVPVFGRDAFGLAAAKLVKGSDKDLFIYEAFNKEECDLFLHFLDSLPSYDIKVVTVVRDGFEGGEDKRELLDSYYGFAQNILIRNSGTVEEYREAIAQELKY